MDDVAKVLVVDDEPNIREVVELYLRRDGHDVVTAADGEEALKVFRNERPDLVVLDLMLPKVSGTEVCRRMGSEGRRVPMIMLTARSEEEDRIIGLGLGADDYVTKPFSPRELAARVEAVLRRTSEAGNGASGGKALEFDALRIDPVTREARLGGTVVPLTAREFELLYFMASRRRQVFTREQLMETVWGHSFSADTSTVTVHIRRLREKLEPEPKQPRYLQTVWGVGYRFGG